MLFIQLSCEKLEILKEKILLENIPIVDGRFHFKDHDEFSKVRQDFYAKPKEYKKYLMEIDFPSYLVQKEKLLNKVNDEMTEQEFKRLIKSHHLFVKSDQELTLPFKFSYENAFNNLDGEIVIGRKIKRSENLNPNILGNRVSNAACTVSQDFKSCNSKRFKGQVFHEVENVTSGCSAFIVCEGRVTWFKKFFGVWIHDDATSLTVTTEHSAFNFRSDVNNIMSKDPTSNTILNEDEAHIFTQLVINEIGNFCNPLTSENVGLINAKGTYVGQKTDCSPTIRNLSIPVCNQ
jgi:hypothetical protein